VTRLSPASRPHPARAHGCSSASSLRFSSPLRRSSFLPSFLPSSRLPAPAPAVRLLRSARNALARSFDELSPSPPHTSLSLSQSLSSTFSSAASVVVASALCRLSRADVTLPPALDAATERLQRGAAEQERSRLASDSEIEIAGHRTPSPPRLRHPPTEGRVRPLIARVPPRLIRQDGRPGECRRVPASAWIISGTI